MSDNRMKAIAWAKYGPPEILTVVEGNKPVPGENEILIKVMASTVNRTDCAMLRAKPFIMRMVTGLLKPKISTTGTDVAGIVEAVGGGVSAFQAGDKVFGFEDLGFCSHAQYIACSSKKPLVKIPEGFTYEGAVACVEGTHYAYNIVNKVSIQPGQAVLVNGATGAIGSASVQLAKYAGAKVTAVCQAKDFELVRNIGADELIDYTTDDFTKSTQKYDYIFDAVGKSSFGLCKPILSEKGVYISSELGWMGQNIFFALLTPLFSKKKVKFPIPLDKMASMILIAKLMEEGKLRPVIDRTYKLEQIVEAFSYVERGQKIGNVIVQPWV